MITLTENEYNLVVYCIEQQMYEFNKEEYEDSSSIIKKLSQITEAKWNLSEELVSISLQQLKPQIDANMLK